HIFLVHLKTLLPYNALELINGNYVQLNDIFLKNFELENLKEFFERNAWIECIECDSCQHWYHFKCAKYVSDCLINHCGIPPKKFCFPRFRRSLSSRSSQRFIFLGICAANTESHRAKVSIAREIAEKSKLRTIEVDIKSSQLTLTL
ncbi:hypothetical protein BpHYR1_053676, partial [Brachionus plicatilis]